MHRFRSIFLAGLLACPGCSDQDAARVKDVGVKSWGRATAWAGATAAQLDAANPTLRPAAADLELTCRLYVQLHATPALRGAAIQVQLSADGATVRGTVGDEAQHRQALDLVTAAVGSRRVVDELKVAGRR